MRIRNIMLRYFLYKHDYRIFKPVEITYEKDFDRKEKNRGDEPVCDIICIDMEMSL
jgi:hypothetical protein